MCCLHVAWLFLEDGGSTAGKRVHVGRDGTDGHVAGPRSFLDGIVVPRCECWRVRADRTCERTENKRIKRRSVMFMSERPERMT